VLSFIWICGCWAAQEAKTDDGFPAGACTVLEFADPVPLGDFTDFAYLAFADADLDGDLDVFGTRSPYVVLLENTGAPASEWTETTIGTGFVTSALFARDVDGDGLPDAIAELKYNAGVGWMENPGGDGEWGVRQVSGDCSYHYLRGADDFDGDEKVDFLVRCVTQIGDDGWTEFSDLVLFRNEDAQSDAWTELPVESEVNARAVDFDGDGATDILVEIPEEQELYWYEYNPLHLSDWEKHLVQAHHDPGTAMWPMDFDGDGDLDLAYRSSWKILMAWLNVDGVGEKWSAAPGYIDVGEDIVRLAAGDLDMDGDDDGAFIIDANLGVGPSEYGLVVMRNGWIGEGARLDLIGNEFFSPSGPPRPYFADLDSDGDLDLILSCQEIGVLFFENLCVS